MTLENVKIGDRLIQHGQDSYSKRHKRLVRVTRLTSRWVFVFVHGGEVSYRKTDGGQVGGGAWGTNKCTIPTDGEVDAMGHAAQIKRLRKEISTQVSNADLSLTTLQQIEKILNEG